MAFKEAKVKKLYGKNTGSWGGVGIEWSLSVISSQQPTNLQLPASLLSLIISVFSLKEKINNLRNAENS